MDFRSIDGNLNATSFKITVFPFYSQNNIEIPTKTPKPYLKIKNHQDRSSAFGHQPKILPTLSPHRPSK
jgi:hypothetical protein